MNYVKSKHNSLLQFVSRRSVGDQASDATVYSPLYKSLRKVYACNSLGNEGCHGAVFNVEFSPDGKLLAAACERLDVILLDPLSQKRAGKINLAHFDCVNCVRFLDTRTFATCSDDCTVAIWDSRNLNSKVFDLVGHSGWVKSLEYNCETKQLLTSAFDDTVRIWDINSSSGDGRINGSIICRVLNLTRTKLTRDYTKLIISTTSGAILIVSQLDLSDLKENGFLASSYASPPARLGYPANRNVERKRRRNIIEVLKDFPQNSNPWCVSSLDVHPYSWCIVSRYTSKCGRDEWTAVHDIQDFNLKGVKIPQAAQQRLTHFIEESSVAQGYIKEICFNEDGRLVCSPFGNGVRVLGFDSHCGELCDNVPETPAKLTEISSVFGHKDSVVTCRFSPTLPLLATGCLGGEIGFYQPRF